MSDLDIRWKQRFSNYIKALQKLEEAVLIIKNNFTISKDGKISNDEFLDDIIKEGLIQRFEYTHELAWNVMKDFLQNSGHTNIFGSRDATKEAFAAGLIKNGEIWMNMIISRNNTSHTYNQNVADEIFLKIINEYYPEFVEFRKKMEQLSNPS